MNTDQEIDGNRLTPETATSHESDGNKADPIAGNVEAPRGTSSRETAVFNRLGPDCILDALESVGYTVDGRVNALNSYENRVYQVGLDSGGWVVAKFYRPGRWSDETILEEHAFARELAAVDVPAVCAERAPDNENSDSVLHHHADFRFSIYPLAGGRPPELDNAEQLEVIGRTIARLHNIGELSPFEHRLSIDVDRLGNQSRSAVINSDFLPVNLIDVYSEVSLDILAVVRRSFAAHSEIRQIRVHGDFHPGNILWGSNDTPHILDLDDCCSGPAIQDLWMFLSGDRPYRTARVADLLEGYTQFREFDPAELALIEPLRALRQIFYTSWIARRWDDPAFARAFPFFAEARYWDEHILALREQRAALDEEPIRWD